jgi:hypothetical protein
MAIVKAWDDKEYIKLKCILPSGIRGTILLEKQDFREAVAECLGATVIGDGITNPFRGDNPTNIKPR